MTNGQITKKIVSACKTKSGIELQKSLGILLRSFPLSSHMMVYDAHKRDMTEANWEILMKACEKTDNDKLKFQHKWLIEQGVTPTNFNFGRATLKCKA